MIIRLAFKKYIIKIFDINMTSIQRTVSFLPMYFDQILLDLKMQQIFFLSALLQLHLCWDRVNHGVPPTLDATLLYSSKVGSDLGLELPTN